MPASPWPADHAVRRATSALLPSARNARTHSESQIAQIASSIEAFGWTIPILIDEADAIIAGHGRIEAAHRLNIAEVPCIVATHWTEAQKRAYMLADNQLALVADWDTDRLRQELDYLQSIETFDIGSLGFSNDDLAFILAKDQPEDDGKDDHIPSLPANPKTRPGDIWRLGAHTLICADARDPETFATIATAPINVVFTSPPYAQQRAYDAASGFQPVRPDDYVDWFEQGHPTMTQQQVWPADHVERRATTGLTPSARNARTHTDTQVAQVARSIETWGWTMPVLIDEAGEIIAGHCRVMAAERLGILQVPVMVAHGWSDAQKRAYLIADNRLTENAAWDFEMLRAELAQLGEYGFDATLTGYTDEDLAELLLSRTAGHTDPDDAPARPEAPTARPGDLFLLGRHRLICGDATDANTVARLLGADQPNLMVTDPPYGVDYDPDWRNRAARNSQYMGNRAIGAGAVGRVHNDDRADWRAAWAHYHGDVAYTWHGGLHAAEAADALLASGFDIRTQIIWAKNHFAIGRGDYHWQHEPCWYAVRHGRPGNFRGGHAHSTLWQIAKPQSSETGHSAQKPVECMKRPIENSSRPGEAVYDPFVGSGTTIIAAEMSARRCLCAEIDPGYCDVAVLRWQIPWGGW